MKKIFLLLISFSSIQLAICQSANEKAISQAVIQLKQAMLDANGAQLDALTLKELNYGHSNGRVENKEAFIKALVSGQSDFSTMDISDQTIQITGNIALVRHTVVADVVDSGNAFKVKLHVLTVWRKTESGWKLLARHASKI